MTITVNAAEAAIIRRMVEVERWEPDAAMQHVERMRRQNAPDATESAESAEKVSGDGDAPESDTGAKKKRHKYHAKPVTIDGHKFPSQAEGRRYKELKMMRDNGLIKGLELQPRYKLSINGVHITTYVADFRYIDIETGETVVEDVKGFRTDVYKLKHKLMRVLLDIDVQEIRA